MTGDPADLIAELRATREEHRYSRRSELPQHIVQANLIDEYRLAIHPVALGDGLRLFVGPHSLTMSHSQNFDGGPVVNTYLGSDR